MNQDKIRVGCRFHKKQPCGGCAWEGHCKVEPYLKAKRLVTIDGRCIIADHLTDQQIKAFHSKEE